MAKSKQGKAIDESTGTSKSSESKDPPTKLVVSAALVQPEVVDVRDVYDVKEGLYKFYSSQAQALLAQYENINQLLGPTDDFTGPGTLCEVLVRDLLRRNLPLGYAVDKGFIFGRRNKGDRQVHSPEIDLIIHDISNYRPIYRLEDFVIVEPRAVLAIIQVKRTLDAAQLKKAVDNLVDAKRHLRDCWYGGGLARNVYSAAVFFGDALVLQNGGISESYKTAIHAMNCEEYPRPDFLGSLGNRFYLCSQNKQRYFGQFSNRPDGNAALLSFLAHLSLRVLPASAQPPFFVPDDFKSDETIYCLPEGQPVAEGATVKP